MKTAIIIPYRGTLDDKSRLRKDLNESIVEILLYKMTQNVIDELLKIEDEFSIYILTKRKQISFKGDFEIIIDEGEELNDSVSRALQKLEEQTLVIIMADMPLIQSEDIEKILKLHREKHEVVLAPTTDNGTSILCFNREIKIPKVFGKHSALRFKEWFEKYSIPHCILRYNEAYRDIDTFKDLIELKKNNILPEWLQEILKDSVINERKN